MLFKDIDDCCNCPFFYMNVETSGAFHRCSGDVNEWRPCEEMNKYGKYSLEEVVDEVNEDKLSLEAYLENEYRKEELKREKIELAAKKRKETYYANYAINKEITRLKRIIRKREDSISSLRSLTSAFAMTNAMFDMREIPDKVEDCEQVKIWIEHNKADMKRLNELIAERKKRNTERRKKKE